MNKRKSILALALVLVLGIGLLSGCGSTKTTTARLVKTTDTYYDADGLVTYASSESYDYATSQYTSGTQLGESESWEYTDGTFTFDDTGILSIYCENTETGYWERTEYTLWDNGNVKTSSYESSDEIYLVVSYNEEGREQERHAYAISPKYDLTEIHTYTNEQTESIGGKSLPTYICHTYEDEMTFSDDSSSSSGKNYISVSYDKKGHITEEVYSDESGQTTKYIQYTYDSNWNITREEFYAPDDNEDFFLYSVTENTYE